MMQKDAKGEYPLQRNSFRVFFNNNLEYCDNKLQ